MAYSCAYLKNELAEVQQQKLDLICRKLRLEWGRALPRLRLRMGSLVIEAGRRGALADGFTLSREQCRTAQDRIPNLSCCDECQAEMRDHRRMEETEVQFDKTASVGIYEHVGLKNLPTSFGVAFRLLRPGGLFLNHGIATAIQAPVWKSSLIARNVLPSGRLVTLAEATAVAESQAFKVRDVECLRDTMT